ncbi:reverse transcriptase domain-containing protein [Tanacetum coccineum]
MPSNVKTYDGSEDPEDNLKIFQANAKVECWAMPTWCHMFNSTLIGSAREGESTKDFVQRFKSESRHVKGAQECMRISRFMHGITNPELIKHLHDNIPKSVDEMMRATTAFLRGEVADSNQARKKAVPAWKQPETGRKQNFDKRGDFRNQQRLERRSDRFTLLTKSPKEILALDKGRFKAPPSMSTPVEKRNNNKFCEFHGEVGHNTDECMHLKRQIEELIKDGKVTQSFSPDPEISFPPLGDEDGTEGPMIIEAEIGGHFIHLIYVDGELTSEILYEYCFSRLCLEVKSQMVPATAPLIGFSREIIWPIGQISLSVKIGDTKHSMSTRMNFVVVRSPSPYNGIIGRPEVRKIQAFPSTAHGMLKFPVPGGILTLRSSKLIPLECTMVSGPEVQPSVSTRVMEEIIKVAQPRHIRLETSGHDRGSAACSGEPVERSQRMSPTEAAFKQMKMLIAELPTLTAPMEKEELIVYLAAAREAVSAVLMTEKEAKPRVSIKGQILVDFIVERPEDDSLAAPMEVEEELSEPWTLFTNGSSYVDGSGAELIFTNPEGIEFTYALRFEFNATNNEAEYEALIAGLRIVLVEVLKEKSINEAEVLTVVEEEGNTWMTPIYEYLTEETLPVEINSRSVWLKSRRYAIINGVLYKKSFLEPWL